MYKIYTDGGCSGNPGPGGWAYVIIEETFQGDSTPSAARIIAQNKGAQPDTTNNKMELTAVIEALRELKEKKGSGIGDREQFNEPLYKISVYTDSQYVQRGISDWIIKWKRNSWRTSGKSPVKNKELWATLDSLASEFSINWEWVKGHAGNEYNELCDSMTQEAIASII